MDLWLERIFIFLLGWIVGTTILGFYFFNDSFRRKFGDMSFWLVIATMALVLVTAVTNISISNDNKNLISAEGRIGDADEEIRDQARTEATKENTPALVLDCKLMKQRMAPPSTFILYSFHRRDKNDNNLGALVEPVDFQGFPNWINGDRIMHQPSQSFLCSLTNIGKLSISLIRLTFSGVWRAPGSKTNLWTSPGKGAMPGMASGGSVQFAIGNADDSAYVIYPKLEPSAEADVVGVGSEPATITAESLFAQALLNGSQHLDPIKQPGPRTAQ